MSTTVNVVSTPTTINVTSTGTTINGNTVVTVLSFSGAGPVGPQGANFDPTTTWISLVVGVEPSAEVSIPSGEVLTYDYGDTTLYRFIASDDSLDAFYSTFDGTNLTGLVATKALSF